MREKHSSFHFLRARAKEKEKKEEEKKGRVVKKKKTKIESVSSIPLLGLCLFSIAREDSVAYLKSRVLEKLDRF